MKRIGIVALAAVMCAFGVVAVAQQQGSPNEPSPQASKGETSQPGMIGRGMMGMMGQMGAHHQQMVGKMNKLIQSMSAIEAENDPAALKAKLAAHRALLEQMRSQMMQQGGIMQHMQGRMGGSTNNQPPVSK